MIQLGDKVRDVVSGFEGIAICRSEWITGCIQIGVQTPVNSEGKSETNFFDIDRLEAKTIKDLQKGPAMPIQAAATGGPSLSIPERQHP